MRTQALVGAAMLVAGAAMAAGLIARAHARERARVALRLAIIRATVAATVNAESPLRRIGAMLAATPILGSSEVGQLRRNLYSAGFVGQAALERFIGLKIALAVLMIGFALALPGALGFSTDLTVKLLLVVGGTLLGCACPTWSSARARKRGGG